MEYLVDPGVPVVSETGRRRRGYRGGRDHAIGTVAGAQGCGVHVTAPNQARW